MKRIFLFFFVFLLCFGSVGYADTWQINSTINSSLGDIGDRSAPTVFQKDGTWYLISGEEYGGFYGFNWTGSTWQPDSTINSSLGDIGGRSAPTVFQKDSTWYLISGEYFGSFYGFNWTGSTWQSDSAIVSGLGGVTSMSTPTIFQKDSTWYLISGEFNGVFYGYNWTGSTWQPDSTINSSLGDIGARSAPTVFQKDSTWYLIAGESTGSFYGYNWTGSTWQSDSAIASGLGDVGGFSAPTVFQKDGTWYIISGEKYGSFNGYNWIEENVTENITGELTWKPTSLITEGIYDDDLEVVPHAYNQNDSLRIMMAYAQSGVTNVHEWSDAQSRWNVRSDLNDGFNATDTYDRYPKPAVYFWENHWRTIFGSVDGLFYGYMWNDTSAEWQRDYWIVQGLPNLTAVSSPAIFYKDGAYKMIAGNILGKFYGYGWNGSIWTEDTSLVSGIAEVSGMSTPTVFEYNDEWYITIGDMFGNIVNYKWSGSTWVSVLSLDDSIGDLGENTAPTVFEKDNTTYMIALTQTGEYYGYYLNDESCIPSIVCSEWTACNSSNQQSRVCDDGCGDIYTEVQSCVYEPPCVSDIVCTDWSACNSSNQQSRTCTDLGGCVDDTFEVQGCIYELTDLTWYEDNSIIVGLDDDDLEVVPHAYNQNDSLRLMMAYESSGVINVHEWSDAQSRWNVRSDLNDGLVAFASYYGYAPKPAVYFLDGAWRAIIGDNSGDFFGYTWFENTTEWAVDTYIVTGLPSYPTIPKYTAPTIFYKDGEYKMIFGDITGRFNGYYWNGASWVSDSSLTAGDIVDIGSFSTPSVFEYESNWYLTAGDANGDIVNYKWSDTNGWISVPSLDDSIGDLGSKTAPTVFEKNGIIYMIVINSGGDLYGYSLQEPVCVPDFQCSQWSSCFFEGDERIKQRLCHDLNNCTTDEIEKTACDITPDPEESGEDFYSPTPPASFMMIPKIVIPATDNTAPNINSQTVTGFACFTNWYGYGDNMLDRMEYTINGITTTVYPNESHEPCGKGLNCPKPFGYIQTWDYLNKYFTQYDNYNTNLTVTCYDANGSTQSLSLTLNAKEEDYCYTTDDTVTKECFSFNDKMDNHIYSATDLNLKPTFAFDLDRITPAENTPDWQMYRVSTDIVNYFSSEAYTNDAKDSFNKITQKEGYQIIELFTSPQDEAQVYFDVMFEDIYPKYFLFTDSDGQVQILLMFYNNEVYYFDGYRFKSMGAYTLNTPYTVEVDFDVDNQRFNLGLNTWHLYMDDSYNVYSWKKIGSWSYNNKIGTFITQIDDSKDIKYMAITLMSEFCNSDSDCSSVVGSPNYYAGTSSISPAFSDNWGFKQINQHLHKTDGSYLRYFDDKQEGNTGVMTINTWDDLENGIYNAGSLLSVIWESEGQGWWCYGTADKTVDVYAREGTGLWYYQDTMSISTSSSPQSYSRTINVSFDQIKFVFNISGATCWYSSRGSIDFDSVRATNITAGGERECRDIDWFADTFTNTSGNLEWAFDKSMNNSDFMLEWDDDIYTNLKLDRDTWDGGYCYSDMIIDNIETFTTRSTFHESEESSKKKKFTYEWLEKLGWNLEGNQGNISGDSGAYVSNYYDWDVCTKDGRQYNKGMWCMLNVHAQVLWDIVIGNIYGNFGAFLMFILLLALLSSFVIMLK